MSEEKEFKVKDPAGRVHHVTEEEKEEFDLVKTAYKKYLALEKAKKDYEPYKKMVIDIAKKKKSTTSETVRVSPVHPVAKVTFGKTTPLDHEKVGKLDKKLKKPFSVIRTYKPKPNFEDLLGALPKADQARVKSCYSVKPKSPGLKFEAESGSPKDKK